jgi:hypothetical protein
MEPMDVRIDLTGWTFGFGALDKVIAPDVALALEATLRTHPPELHLLSDGNIELVLDGLSGADGDPPSWQVPLASLVEAELALATLPSSGIDQEQHERLDGIASALEAAAAQIRRALR